MLFRKFEEEVIVRTSTQQSVVARYWHWLLVIALGAAGLAVMAYPSQQAGADEHCDTTVADGEDIQADGVDAAADGETVCVEDGTYEGNVSIDKSLTLVALNEHGAVIEGASVFSPSASDIAIDGFQFEVDDRAINTTTGDPVDNLTISNNRFVDLQNEAIGTAGSQNEYTNWTIEGNQVFGIQEVTSAFFIHSVSDSTISGNVIDGRFDEGGDYGVRSRGIQLDGAEDLEVSANTLRNLGDQGIQVADLVAAASGITITGNVVENAGTERGGDDQRGAIRLYSGDEGGLSNISVADNHLSGSGAGIEVRSGALGWTDVTIAFNAFIDNDVDVRNRTDGTIDTTLNWWGDEDGPGTDDTVGGVTFDPWIAALELDPEAHTLPVGSTFDVDATLIDSDDDDIAGPGLTVRFERAGANPGDEDVAFDGATATHSFTVMDGTTTLDAEVLYAGVPAGPVATGSYVGHESNIELAKAADPGSALAGSEVTFTVTVINAGNEDVAAAPAGSVTVTDEMPSGVGQVADGDISVTGDVDYTCTVDNNTVTCVNDDDHGVNETATIAITATLDAGLEASVEVENEAEASGTSQDAAATASATVVVDSKLDITKTAEPATMFPGGLVTFTVTVDNVSGSGIGQSDITFVDLLPDAIASVESIERSGPISHHYSCSPGAPFDTSDAGFEISCVNDTAGHGSEPVLEMTIVATVADDAAAGDYTNTVEASVGGVSDASASVTFTVEDEPEEPATHTYTLDFRWTLIGWFAPDIDIEDALRGEGANQGGSDIYDDVTVVWGWDGATQTWAAYFTGDTEVPGADTLDTFETGKGYWIAIDAEAGVNWDVVLDDPEEDDEEDDNNGSGGNAD